MSVAAAKSKTLLLELETSGVPISAVVGEITEGPDGQIQVVP
jgi:hypothetical protein